LEKNDEFDAIGRALHVAVVRWPRTPIDVVSAGNQKRCDVAQLVCGQGEAKFAHFEQAIFFVYDLPLIAINRHCILH
jgi:hypothetical protein